MHAHDACGVPAATASLQRYPLPSVQHDVKPKETIIYRLSHIYACLFACLPFPKKQLMLIVKYCTGCYYIL